MGFSSLGDWIGMIAILALVRRLTQDEFAVALILLARLVPALIFGPAAGVVIDRWNRKWVMVSADLARAGLIVTLPFLETVARTLRLSPIVVLFVISAAMEVLSITWQSAKDAGVPRMLKPGELTHGNSLLSMAAYGTFPLSGAAFGLLVPASRWLGSTFETFREFRFQEEHLAFFFDSFSFLVSGVLIATIALKRSTEPKEPLNIQRALAEVAEGLRFISTHPRIRPWVLGIGMIYAGVGTFLAISVFYVGDVLGAGTEALGLLVTVLGSGLGLGFLLAGVAARVVQRDVLFSASVLGLGAGMMVFSIVSTLSGAAPLGVLVGLFAGLAYPSAVSLVQENVGDDIRGRVVASTHSVVRLALVGALALAPAMAKIFGGWQWDLLGRTIDLRGVRVVLFGGGLLIIVAGLITTRAVAARWKGLGSISHEGLFVVFEGGEGSGKSTQIVRLGAALETLGYRVVISREPGGTKIGERIRDILLDPASKDMSAKAEALLYAADRSQHVEEVIKPHLARGAVVISDRFVDSSLAYQGIGRGLGVDQVFDLNLWGTAGLIPDQVFYLDFEPSLGLERAGTTDRIEEEGLDFHRSVREAYRGLARKYPDRFAIIDGGLDQSAIAKQALDRVLSLLKSDKVEASK